VRAAICAAAVAALTLSAPVSADDGRLDDGGGSESFVDAVSTDPALAGTKAGIEGYFDHNLVYYECSVGMPPVCWKVAELWFYTHVDLGYRVHKFRSKIAVTFGADKVPWTLWTGKQHKVRCLRSPDDFCGDLFALPITRTWSSDVAYVPDQFPGYFRFRYYACAKGVFCALGFHRTPDVFCSAKDVQCYFIHD
jgi:hypothetical protein